MTGIFSFLLQRFHRSARDARSRAIRRSRFDSLTAPEPALDGLDADAIRAEHDQLVRARSVARSLAAALDRAMELGLFEHAERIALSAARIAPAHAILTERLARLRMGRGDHERALTIIQSCPRASSSLRLLGVTCLLRLGRRYEAHADLRQWARRSWSPLQARTLLALLEWDEGDFDASGEALQRNLRQIEDPQSLLALTMMNAADANCEQASMWAERLHRACAWTEAMPQLNLMLDSIGCANRLHSHPQPTSAQVQVLATELLASEDVIPALVEAQRLRLNPAAATLLIGALECALEEFENPANGFAAIATLHMLLDEEEAAADWVKRGLEACPMSVALVRFSAELKLRKATFHPQERAA